MAQWFQANIRYTQQDDQGKQKTVNEVYLFDSVSYTDAEAKTYAYVADNWPDFQLISIKRLKMQEVFFVENGADLWFKAKVQYITFDEKSQKEKKTAYNMLINAENVKDAYDLLRERLGPINDYIISDINSTNILEVIPYENIEDKVAAGRLTPLSEVDVPVTE